MKKILCYALLCMILGTSCSDFLDLKPDQKMVVPKTLTDCELLLNDYSSMNMGYPTFGEIASDDYYLNAEDWKSLSEMDERNAYTWSDEPVITTTQWQNPYKTVYLANQILKVMEDIAPNQEPDRYKKVMSAAHFFRAFAFHQVTTVFTMPYRPGNTGTQLGIPLRLNPDLDYLSVRSSMEQTCQQIINDYKMAASDLPVNEPLAGRPHKAAAYAGLARLYLEMSDYTNAYTYADLSLKLKADLLDYNDLDEEAPLPVPRFNKEVLFPAVSGFSGVLGQYFCRIDDGLYRAYTANDLRKAVFFQHNDFDPDAYAFKGSYDNTSSGLFVGLTTSEMYLVRAEAGVRTNKITGALKDLNTLLKNRIDPDHFSDITETDPEKLLQLILDERRKELLFRGIRWADLKRLNQDGRFKKTLIRSIDGIEYKLEPASLKYGIKIPEIVISETHMPQNKR